MAIGTCKLTGAQGKLVKSHLIPKAFTRPEEPGLPLVQAGSGRRATRRWDSWYDPTLVTRHGEDILEAYDTWAVAYLRRKRLVWSGWGDAAALEGNTPIGDGGWGVRSVPVHNPKLLRLFFLSLLWRAAASELVEFAEVQLPGDHMERLRKLVEAGEPGSASFYPISLVQLSTRGTVHNMAPIADVKHQPQLKGIPARDIPIFRFYFDGLIAHVVRQADDEGWASSLGNIMVGQADDLLVSTVTYETSFQKENLRFVMAETIW